MLFPSPDKQSQIVIRSQTGDRRLKAISSSGDEERGVHGGQTSVRPNVQESMTFLRKLFTHQQENVHPFPNSLSPPDGPFRKFIDSGRRSHNEVPNTVCILEVPNSSNHGESLMDQQMKRPKESKQLGVYIRKICIEQVQDRASLEVCQLCSHNAEVCAELGESGKSDVWKLLEKVVRGQIGQHHGGFDGSLVTTFGATVVNGILDYYENLRDVQLLATIACVLRSHRMRASGKSLLSRNQDIKCDSYILRYADILYGWGMLVTRAELLKHLVRPLPSADGLYDPSVDASQRSGFGLAITCPGCDQETEFGTSFCRTCDDNAFRCSLCDLTVRGLVSICEVCGHGGHLKCLQEWFSNHDQCPSGCGCSCILPNDAAPVSLHSQSLGRPLPSSGYIPSLRQP